MTPEHGYIYIAIGAALFASLLVAWLLGRRAKPRLKPGKCYVGTHPSGAGFIVKINRRWDADPHQVFAQFLHAGQWDTESLYSERATRELVHGEIEDPTLPHDPKPAPYSPGITGTGSRPEAPWVTREELDAAEQRVNDGLDDLAARLEALESKRGGEGWRVFKAADWTWVWTGEELHVRFKPCQWTPSGYSLPAELYEQVAGVTELHGPERARIVREFLEWRASQ